MSFRDWYFEFPRIGYIIIAVIPLIFLFRALFKYRRQAIEALIQPSYIKQLVLLPSDFLAWAKAISFCLVWVFACLSLMDPRGNFRYINNSTTHQETTKTWKQQPRDLIFLVDASSSMTATDARSGKSRFEAAKEIVDEIISHLEGESGSLYAFTSEPIALSPPTLDYLFLRLTLRQLSINEGGTAGTDIASALKTLRQKYWSNSSNKHYTVVILSDGEDTVLEGLEGDARAKAMQLILDPIRNSLESHLRVFTIGLGTTHGTKIPNVLFQGKPVISRLHEDLLKDISLIGRGEYYQSSSLSVLDIVQSLDEKLKEDAVYEQQETQKAAPLTEGDTIYSLYYQLPLGIALAILILILFFPSAFLYRDRGESL